MRCRRELLSVVLLGVLLLPLPGVAPDAKPDCVVSHNHLRVVRKHDYCALALRAPKVALLFLLVGNVPHEKVWIRWFSDVGATAFSACRDWSKTEQFLTCTQPVRADPIAQQHLFSVYVHTDPSFTGYPPEHLFYGYELTNRVEAHWIDTSAAMFALIHEAVQNPFNRYFVLLSEACLPLYPAKALYLQIVHEPKSHVYGGCDNVPDFGSRERWYRSLLWEEEYPMYKFTKTSQWFLLNRNHAELAARHADDWLLNTSDEWYLGTLLNTFDLGNETTCDWQGPTYTNWTADSWHPTAYHSMDSDLLRRMRLGSIFDVDCNWEDALAQAEEPGRFIDVRKWDWRTDAPAFRPMNNTCPLFARKIVKDAQPSFMATLWPEAAGGQ